MSGTVIETQVDAKSADFGKNSRQMVDRLTEIKNEEERIRQGGGAKAIESQHKKGRLTARERIAKLIQNVMHDNSGTGKNSPRGRIRFMLSMCTGTSSRSGRFLLR